MNLLMGMQEDAGLAYVVLEQQPPIFDSCRWVRVYNDRSQACADLQHRGLLPADLASSISLDGLNGQQYLQPAVVLDPKRTLHDFHLYRIRPSA